MTCCYTEVQFQQGLTGPTLSVKQQAILVGMHLKCHVQLRSLASPPLISRFHLVVFPLPSQRMLWIVDPGSLNGVHTVSRSNADKPCVHSTLKCRRHLEFDWGEEIVLDLGVGEEQLIVRT